MTESTCISLSLNRSWNGWEREGNEFKSCVTCLKKCNQNCGSDATRFRIEKTCQPPPCPLHSIRKRTYTFVEQLVVMTDLNTTQVVLACRKEKSINKQRTEPKDTVLIRDCKNCTVKVNVTFHSFKVFVLSFYLFASFPKPFVFEHFHCIIDVILTLSSSKTQRAVNALLQCYENTIESEER
jgi:hypothetical protein